MENIQWNQEVYKSGCINICAGKKTTRKVGLEIKRRIRLFSQEGRFSTDKTETSTNSYSTTSP